MTIIGMTPTVPIQGEPLCTISTYWQKQLGIVESALSIWAEVQRM